MTDANALELLPAFHIFNLFDRSERPFRVVRQMKFLADVVRLKKKKKGMAWAPSPTTNYWVVREDDAGYRGRVLHNNYVSFFGVSLITPPEFASRLEARDVVVAFRMRIFEQTRFPAWMRLEAELGSIDERPDLVAKLSTRQLDAHRDRGFVSLVYRGPWAFGVRQRGHEAHYLSHPR